MRRELVRPGQGVGLGAAAGDDGFGGADDEQRLIGESGREVIGVQVDDVGTGVDHVGHAGGAAIAGSGLIAVADLAQQGGDGGRRGGIPAGGLLDGLGRSRAVSRGVGGVIRRRICRA